MENDQERLLVEASLAGNSDALAELLTSVKDSVFNLSLRMLGNVFDAEDATQEILLKAMTNLSSLSSIVALAPGLSNCHQLSDK